HALFGGPSTATPAQDQAHDQAQEQEQSVCRAGRRLPARVLRGIRRPERRVRFACLGECRGGRHVELRFQRDLWPSLAPSTLWSRVLAVFVGLSLLLTGAFLWAFAASSPEPSRADVKPRGSWSRRLSAEWVRRLSVVVDMSNAPAPSPSPAQEPEKEPQPQAPDAVEWTMSPRAVSSPVSFRKSSVSLDDV
ncbi:hypothetical protein PINS_up024073, partial [Pythium insidiosum]